MAHPLCKIKKDGTLYARPSKVAAAIDRALSQDLVTIQARARIRDSKSPDHLPSECLVHLIRKAHRENNTSKTRDALLGLLLERCAANFNKTIVPSIPNAPDVRNQLLSEFTTLFLIDGTPEDEHHALDFFECRFNLALLSASPS